MEKQCELWKFGDTGKAKGEKGQRGNGNIGKNHYFCTLRQQDHGTTR
ncbi:MAG: hypothetical protein IKX22_07930 [Prevotella sp.]|nr:hypothetical protein [Prevotella sp.]